MNPNEADNPAQNEAGNLNPDSSKVQCPTFESEVMIG